MLNSNDMKDKDTAELLVRMMKVSFMETKPQKGEALVNFIQSNVLNSSDFCSVKTSKRDTLISRGETKVVQCRANINATPEKFPVPFEPDIEPLLLSDLEVNQTLLNVPGGASCKLGIQVSNLTNHDIVLKNRTVLGKLQPVKSVPPLEVVHKELPEQKEADLSEGTEPESTPVNDIYLKAFDPDDELSKLSPTQKEIARKLLREECHSFAKSEEEICCVKELLSDERCVQKNYTVVPKPLYGEVRHYVEDFLNRG